MTLSAQVKLEVAATQNLELNSGHRVSCSYGRQLRAASLADGIYASQANRAWECAGRKIEDGKTEDIDLWEFSNVDMGRGSGRDGAGGELRMDEVVLLMILHAGGPGRVALMPTVPKRAVTWVQPGGYAAAGGAVLWFNPAEDAYPVLESARWLRLGAEGGDVEYDIVVIGRNLVADTTPLRGDKS